jgi:hypothetical protein
MTSFYEIQNDLALLLEEIEQQGGEINEEQEQRLDALNLSRDDKLSNWCRYLENMKLTELALSAAIDDLREKKQRAQKMHERSKEQLSRLLGADTQRVGYKWSDGVRTLSWRKSTRCIPMIPLEQMREAFVRVRETRDFNREYATQFIKENGEIPEAVLVEGMNLQIK